MKFYKYGIGIMALPIFAGNLLHAFALYPTRYDYHGNFLMERTVHLFARVAVIFVQCALKACAFGLAWPAVLLIDAPDKYFNGVQLNGTYVYKSEALKTYFYLGSLTYQYGCQRAYYTETSL
jgi:hypothetical protein